MTIDARAYTWCNLGPLSEEGASIAEDHAQGAGVLMLKGTVNLNGIFRPTSGAVVRLAYSDGQTWIAQFPLRLRVLSCFSDPIRNKTTVSVGCDLAYYENRKEPITLDERDENTNVPEAQRRAQTPAISGAWLVGMILCILRIRYDGAIPLTNYYTRQDYDMSGGYVEELGKLCASEGYVCRMNEAGRAEFISKDRPIISSILLTENDLIDLNPVNSGELPGDAAYAKYTSIKLKPPENDDDDDERKKRDWEMEETTGQRETYYHDWNFYTYVPTGQKKKVKDERCITVGANTYPADSLPAGATASADGDLEKPAYETKSFPNREEISYVPYTKTVSEYDDKDRVTYRWSEKRDHFGVQRTETRFTYREEYGGTNNTGGSGGGGTYTAFVCVYQSSEDDGGDLEVRELQPNARPANDDNAGQIIKEVTTEWSPVGPIRMNLGLERKFSDVSSGTQYVSSIRVIEYDRNKKSGVTKTITRNYIPFIQTPDGSEVISKIRNRREPWEDVPVNGSLFNIATRLVESGSEVRIRTEREFGIQKRPNAAQRTTEKNAKTPPDVEEEARLAWAVGAAASQTAVELSPPYAPDDRVVGSGSTYFVIPSDAAQKVLNYARLENRYLFGHRNGVGIQVLPEALPPKPLSVVYLRLKGCTGAFLVNGRTWNLDPSGATVTCDALFWGAIDGTVSNAWFPLPPNTSALPTPVAITSNSNPVPANAIPIPSGFNFSNPDLNTLFGALPANTAPIPPATIAPAIIIKPYRETIFCGAGSGSGAIADPQFWIAQPAGEYLAGSGSGVLATAVAAPWTSLGARWTSGTTFTAGAGTAGPGHGGGERWASGSVFVAGVGSDGVIPGARWTSGTVFTAGGGDDEVELAPGARWTSSSTFSDGTGRAEGAAWASSSTFTAGTAGDGNESSLVTFSNTSSAITIPSSGAATPYPSTINVSGYTGIVSYVEVLIYGFSHTYVGDTQVLLVGPSGAKAVIMSISSDADVSNINLVITDSASAFIPSPPVSGTYKPTVRYSAAYPSPAPAQPYGQNLQGFAGSSPNGTWSLYVYDDISGDAGSISGGWAIRMMVGNTFVVAGARWTSATVLRPGAATDGIAPGARWTSNSYLRAAYGSDSPNLWYAILPVTGSSIASTGQLQGIAFQGFNSRRHIIAFTYSGAEIAAVTGLSSGLIKQLRFYVSMAPIVQPYPDYAIGLKNGSSAINANPGSTGYAVVRPQQSTTFTEGVNTFDIDDFNWTGGSLSFVFAWGYVGAVNENSGATYIYAADNGRTYYNSSSDAGTYVINTSTVPLDRTSRPVIELLI